LVLVVSIIPCNSRFILLSCESHTSLGIERGGTLRFLNLTNQVLRLIHKLGVALLVVSEVPSCQHWGKYFGLIFGSLTLELGETRLLVVLDRVHNFEMSWSTSHVLVLLGEWLTG